MLFWFGMLFAFVGGLIFVILVAVLAGLKLSGIFVWLGGYDTTTMGAYCRLDPKRVVPLAFKKCLDATWGFSWFDSCGFGSLRFR
jgi:hypothetical protein